MDGLYKGGLVHHTMRSFGILVGGLVLLAVAVPAIAAEPPTGVAFDGVVTVNFHDPEYDSGNGIEGADVALTVVDLAEPDIAIQELPGTTDATGVASFTDVARPTDPGVALEIQVIAVRDRSSVNPDGCTVTEHLGGSASAAAGLEVTIDVEVIDQQDETTCPPPVEDPPIIVEGTAVEPDGDPLAIEASQAILGTGPESETLTVETTVDGAFRVEVPAATEPGVERELKVFLVGPEVRTFLDERGCMYFVHLVSQGAWTLVGAEAPEPVTLVAAELVVSAVCNPVQPPLPPAIPNPTPRPPVAPDPTAPPAAPDTTLPPSDTDDLPATEPGGASPAAALVLLLAISLSATLAARRFSRRGTTGGRSGWRCRRWGRAGRSTATSRGPAGRRGPAPSATAARAAAGRGPRRAPASRGGGGTSGPRAAAADRARRAGRRPIRRRPRR